MASSGTVLNDAMRAHLAPGHNNRGDLANNWHMDALAGDGAIHSTVNDMLRYLRANMGVDQSPLAGAMKLAQQPRSDMAKTMQIGLAWMTNRKGIVWHNGETEGYRSFIGFTTDGRRGVILLSNTDAYLDDLGFAALDSDAKLIRAYHAIVLPNELLDEFVGTYKVSDLRSDNQLLVQENGQGSIPFFPSAPNEFFARAIRASAHFTRDPDGGVTGLVLHQNGDHVARKLSAFEQPEND